MELNEYLKIIKSRRTELVGITLFVLLLILFISSLQRPVYRATAVLQYQTNNIASTFLGQMNFPFLASQPERELSTQAALITSEPMAQNVISKLNLKISPEELIRKIDVSFEEKTNLINISVEDNDPRQAQIIASVLTQVFLDNSKKSASSEVSEAKDEVSFRMKDIQEDIQLYSQIADSKKGPDGQPTSDANNIKSQMAIATSIYTELAGKQQQLEVLEDLTTGGMKLAVPAVLPKTPSKPDMAKNTILALVLGLASSSAWVFTTEYLDNTIKTTEDVDKYFKLPVVGQIPLSGNESARREDRTVQEGNILVSPESYTAEAYRTLRTNIQFFNFESQARTIIVTSSISAEGKTTIASNLAATLALSSGNILLMDCDFRRPRIHNSFYKNNDLGLSSVLARSCYLRDAIQPTHVPGLSVITSGPQPPNPSELFGSGLMTDIIETLKMEYDYVVLDTPPVCAVTDAVVLATKVDGVLLVCSFNETTGEVAAESVRLLDKVPSKILGVVMNKIYSQKGRYGRYYGHYYGHYYGRRYGRYYGSHEEDGGEKKTV